MRFKGLDLNLLVALDALLEECSVSKAARRLHITQPSMSASLARLREFFKDDILVVHGKQMIRTSAGESLTPKIKALLSQIDLVTSNATDFDPSVSDRSFRIVASDYITSVVLAPLLNKIQNTAPGVHIHVRLATDSSIDQLNRGEVDLLLTPTQFVSRDHPADLIFEEEHIVVGWRHNPIFDRPLDREAFLSVGHIAVAIGPQALPTYAERKMHELGIKRNIEMVAPSFIQVPWLLIGSNRLAIMHRRLAALVSPLLPLRSAPMPFPFPVMQEMMQYHLAREFDAGLTWLRREVLEMAAQM